MKLVSKWGGIVGILVFLCASAQAQLPRASSVQGLITKFSRESDGKSPADQRESATRFESALASADSKDPWWPKAQYDLGYDLAALGEYKRAVKAFEKVLRAGKVQFPGLQAAAADQIAQALEADKAPAEVREAAYRRALSYIREGAPLASFMRMTQRSAIIDAIIDSKTKKSREKIFRELRAFVADGRKGRFSPGMDIGKVSDFDGNSWRGNVEALLRNLASSAVEDRDVLTASRALDLYRKEKISQREEIALEFSISQAKFGEEIPASEFDRLLNTYTDSVPARAWVLSEAILNAMQRDDCPAIKRYAAQLMAMKPMPNEAENPERFYRIARQVPLMGAKLSLLSV